jgi:hypothetical protein
MRAVLLFAVIGLIGQTSRAEAGPYCGFSYQLAPADGTTLPIAPTIALFTEHGYYGGKRKKRAKPLAVRGMLDGKPVKLTTRDVQTVDGVIRFLKITSKRPGKLEIWSPRTKQDPATVIATYTLIKDWTAPTPSATVAPVQDQRLEPYRYIGHAAAVRVALPATSFELEWRAEAGATWTALTLPAHVNDDQSDDGNAPIGDRRKPAAHFGHAEAWLGERMCGMVETVPRAALEKGVEVRISATLPDGTTVEIDVPDPVKLPHKPDPFADSVEP